MGHLLWEVLERTRTGPVMKEDEFETSYFPEHIKKLVQDFKIKCDPNEPVMTDATMADAIFEAGIKLLCECGLYCKDTKHIVKFKENELREVAKTRKRMIEMGTGRDKVICEIRAPEDKQHPYCFNPSGWRGSDRQMWSDAVFLVAREPTTDGLMPVSFEGAFGQKMVGGTPSETLAVQIEATMQKQAATAAGRPGIHMGIPMTATSMVALVGAFDPGFYTHKNCFMPVHILQDMRLVLDRVNLAYFAMEHNIIPWQSCSPTMYAYLSGPEEACIEGMAHSLGQMAYADGSFTQAMSNTIDKRYDGPDVCWVNSAMALSAERNLKCPWISYGGGVTAHRSEEIGWYAASTNCINACISGMEGMRMVGGSPALDARFGSEVTRAAAGMKVSDGVSVIKDIMKKYLPKIQPIYELKMRSLYEMYDQETLKPKKWYMDLYYKMTKEFKDMGFDYPTWG